MNASCTASNPGLTTLETVVRLVPIEILAGVAVLLVDEGESGSCLDIATPFKSSLISLIVRPTYPVVVPVQWRVLLLGNMNKLSSFIINRLFRRGY